MRKFSPPHHMLVFVAAAGVRLLLYGFFKILYGPYAVQHVEAWLFTGVMDGTHTRFLTHRGFDPVAYGLTQIGHLVDKGHHIFAVEASAILLSALTAVAVCLLASRLYGKKTGFYAGLFYAFMVEPVGLSISSFTHDHLQLLLMALGLLLCTIASSKGLFQGFVSSALILGVFQLSRYTSESVNIMVLLMGLYLGYRCVNTLGAFLQEHTKRKWIKKVSYYGYVLLCILVVLAVQKLVFSAALEETLSRLPQGRLGSADIVPIEYPTLWLRFNFLLILLPFGIAKAFKERDVMALNLTLVGLALATHMDRGTRIMDLGLALFSALAVSGMDGGFDAPWFWKDFLRRKMVKSHKMLYAMIRKADFSLVAFCAFGLALCIASIPMVFGWFEFQMLLAGNISYALNPESGFIPRVFVCFATALAFASLCIIKRRGYGFGKNALLVAAVFGVVVNGFYISQLEPRKITTQAEYDAAKYLSQLGDMRVLTSWDKGYMYGVVSGKRMVSAPHYIDRVLHNSLWLNERAAALLLRQKNVRYLVLNSENFNVVTSKNQSAYRIVGGFVFTEGDIPNQKYAPYTTVYKLRHDVGLSQFRLLRKFNDPATGLKVFIYEVEDGLKPKKTQPVVSAVVKNRGLGRNVSFILKDRLSQNGSTLIRFRRLGDVSLNDGGVASVAYVVDGNLTSDCEIIVQNQDYDGETIAGSVSFINEADAGNKTITVSLLETLTKSRVSTHNKVVELGHGQVYTYGFRFTGLRQNTPYSIDVSSTTGLKAIEDATSHWFEGVDFIQAKC